MSKVQLIGHVGKDPEVRSLQNGGKVVFFQRRNVRDVEGQEDRERKERTEWHRIVVFSPGLAGIAEKHIRKGLKVYVEGQLETRKYQDAQKQERYTTEIVLKSYGGAIELLDRKPSETLEAAVEQEGYDHETGAIPN